MSLDLIPDVVKSLTGLRCTAILGVPTCDPSEVAVIYLRIGGIWHRVFVDEGVPFWVQSDPDPDDDLDGEGEYLDLGVVLDLDETRPELSAVTAVDGTLRIGFRSIGTLVLSENMQTSGLTLDFEGP
ncbi:MAG: hypothetical protein AAFY60_03630 [Myxococcota bacterium]